MAGAGYKLFNTGDVLTASDVNTYLQQQVVMVFASSAARSSALTGVLAEGMVTYLQDTNSVQVYNGTAFVAVGGSSPLTTKGDLYTFSTVDARLGVGANGTTLVADSSEATGLKWATPAAGGGMTLISETVANANSAINLTSIPGTHKQLLLVYGGIQHSTSGSDFSLRFNNNATTNAYESVGLRVRGTTVDINADSFTSLQASIGANIAYSFGTSSTVGLLRTAATGFILIDNYASTTKTKAISAMYAYYNDASSVYLTANCSFFWNDTSAITSLDIVRLSGSATISNITNSSIRLYGIS